MNTKFAYTRSDAWIEGAFRYSLTRAWAPTDPVNKLTFMWVMLNPSTADGSTDDPTIRKVRSFTREHGGSTFIVVNLWAYRATRWQTVRDGFKAGENVCGHKNWNLAGVLSEAVNIDRIVLAWGRHASEIDPSNARVREVLSQLKTRSRTAPVCLGTNKDGSPKHPLYVPLATPMVPFNLES